MTQRREVARGRNFSLAPDHQRAITWLANNGRNPSRLVQLWIEKEMESVLGPRWRAHLEQELQQKSEAAA